MTTNICIIGAGSAVFALTMVRDLCLTPNLRGSHITFMDIDAGRLDAIYMLATRYNDEVGSALQFAQTTDRRAALREADVVVNAALAAGHHRLRAGWQTAQALGYRWGGSLHIMHDEAYWINFSQLRLFEEIVEDMLELCPQAWYVQVANPVKAGITHLARHYPQAKLVGLCHGYNAVYDIVRRLGLEGRRITFEVPGVNHFIWLTQLYADGEDAMPQIARWIVEQGPRAWPGGDFGELSPKKCDLFQRFGAFPIGDTAGDGGGSWGWWYHQDDASEARWQEQPARFWHSFFTGGEREVAAINRIAADQQLRVSDHFPPTRSQESIVPLIEALCCDTERVLIVNIPNRGGVLPGVPQDFQVEVPALVSRRGVQGIQTRPLPSAVLAALLRDCVVPTDLELAAYQQRSRALLRELVMLDPWTRSSGQADVLIDTIAALPFHQELREHYR